MDETLRKRYERKSAFLDWCDKDGLSVIGGYGVEDLKNAPLRYWERLGGPAAYCHLEGSQGFVGVLIAEIAAGKSLKPLRHMYEEQILILTGRGATQFWSGAHREPSPWSGKPAAFFRRPLNVQHQHHNGSASEPVRFATANNLPLVMNLYKSADFVFNVPYEFSDRSAGQKDFFNSDLKPGEEEDRVVNFIADLNAVTLDPHPERGVGFSRLGFIFQETRWLATSWPSNPALTRKHTATVPGRRWSSSGAKAIR
jgi:hypothetical protein